MADVKYSETFKRELKRLNRKYRRVRSDIEPLIEDLAKGETPGDQIRGVGYTVYKVRVRNTDARRGKSGGYRVIYSLVEGDQVLLVTVYSKTEQSDIESDELVRIITEEDDQ